jgi:hypothetical protein
MLVSSVEYVGGYQRHDHFKEVFRFLRGARLLSALAFLRAPAGALFRW